MQGLKALTEGMKQSMKLLQYISTGKLLRTFHIRRVHGSKQIRCRFVLPSNSKSGPDGSQDLSVAGSMPVAWMMMTLEHYKFRFPAAISCIIQTTQDLMLKIQVKGLPYVVFTALFSFMPRTHPLSLRQKTSGRLDGPGLIMIMPSQVVSILVTGLQDSYREAPLYICYDISSSLNG